jgi:prepilin-type N-terminal cleavage/methylation domain-containing protein
MIGTTSMRPRQGFTLIELLVATGVFMLGFTAAFSLFLAAMRYRVLADDTTKLSLAASSLVEELAIGNPAQPPTPYKPSQYVGDGKLPLTVPLTGDFAAYPGIPGTWFRVESCTDLLGQDDANSPTLHLNLLVLVDTQSDANQKLELSDLNRRLRLITPSDGWRGTLTPQEETDIRDALVKRGLAMRVSTVVVRRPHWM